MKLCNGLIIDWTLFQFVHIMEVDVGRAQKYTSHITTWTLYEGTRLEEDRWNDELTN